MVQTMGRVDSELFTAWVGFQNEFLKSMIGWYKKNYVENPYSRGAKNLLSIKWFRILKNWLTLSQILLTRRKKFFWPDAGHREDLDFSALDNLTEFWPNLDFSTFLITLWLVTMKQFLSRMKLLKIRHKWEVMIWSRKGEFDLIALKVFRKF